jgi:hypothetical protein
VNEYKSVTAINPKIIPDKSGSTIFYVILLNNWLYLNPLACQTKAKGTGITGMISSKWAKIQQNSGNLLSSIVSI